MKYEDYQKFRASLGCTRNSRLASLSYTEISHSKTHNKNNNKNPFTEFSFLRGGGGKEADIMEQVINVLYT